MLTQEKIEAVKKQLRSGIPEGEIKNELLKEGYTTEDIRTIFTPKSIDMRSWYLLSAIVLIAIGLWAFAANYGPLPLIGGVVLLSLYYNENNKRKKQSAGE